MHRIPLWALGPLCFLAAPFARDSNDNPLYFVIGGIVLTLIFTVPTARYYWRDWKEFDQGFDK